MRSQVLYEKDDHKVIVIGRDPNRSQRVIDTNEYMIVHDGDALLCDPGGVEIFPRVFGEMTRHVKADQVKTLFASHQDPDTISSLAMWLDLCPQATTYCPWLWTRFISHFCMDNVTDIVAVPDEGMEIPVSQDYTVQAVPAHHCHSAGNFSIYDPLSGILLSGDIGAALLPPDRDELFVEDVTAHIEFMEEFHLRWMPSKAALESWVHRARALAPRMIAPQHGAIFAGESVEPFLDWLLTLDVGRLPG